MQCVAVKNQNLSKSKKLVDILVWILSKDLLEVLVNFFKTCSKSRKKTESKNPRVAKTAKANKEKPMLLAKYAERGIKITRFIKEQETRGLLSRLGVKLLILRDIPLVGDILY